MTLRDIAKDLTRYLMESEQAPSALGLSIEHGEGGGVIAAAAFLLQAMPGAEDATLAELEANVKALPRAAALVADGGADVDGLLDRIAGDVRIGERSYSEPRFYCPCDRERATRALRMLEDQELRELIASGQGQEVECQFCGEAYQLEPDELLQLVATR
jgi:molecular chaperone Hsp33